jgi:hypothetical protein
MTRIDSGPGRRVLAALVGGMLFWACGDDATGPIDIPFGETTIVVVVNPPVNDANGASLPAPGAVRSGVTVSADGGPSATSNAQGVAVLADVDEGTRTLTLSGSGLTGTVSVTIAEGDLREVAVALDGTGAAIMRNIEYELSGQVVEVEPTTPLADVNDLLGQSNIIVFFRGGTYTGDLSFSGSSVTVFGEGPQGGQVTLDGDVVIDGSNNRLRGIRVTGSLSVPGSSAGVTFSRVVGDLDVGRGGLTRRDRLVRLDRPDRFRNFPAPPP